MSEVLSRPARIVQQHLRQDAVSKPTVQLNVMISKAEMTRVSRIEDRTGWSRRKIVAMALQVLDTAIGEVDLNQHWSRDEDLS